MEVLLDEAMSVFLSDQDSGWNQLWDVLNLLGTYRSQSYKQQSFRRLGWEGDLTADFVTHIWAMIQSGRFSGKGKFSHWAKKVYRNFANTALSNLTRERNQIVGLAPTPLSAGSAYEEQHYVFTEGVSEASLLTSQRQKERLTEALRGLSNSDKAYVAFLKAGLNQKEAAKRTGESTVTARKREQRIREALQAAGFGVTTPLVTA